MGQGKKETLSCFVNPIVVSETCPKYKGKLYFWSHKWRYRQNNEHPEMPLPARRCIFPQRDVHSPKLVASDIRDWQVVQPANRAPALAAVLGVLEKVSVNLSAERAWSDLCTLPQLAGFLPADKLFSIINSLSWLAFFADKPTGRHRVGQLGVYLPAETTDDMVAQLVSCELLRRWGRWNVL